MHLSEKFIDKLSYDLYVKHLQMCDNLGKNKGVFEFIDNKMSKNMSMCLKLYYLEKLSMVDIAKRLNISVSSVSRNIKKAKEMIQNEFFQHFD